MMPGSRRLTAATARRPSGSPTWSAESRWARPTACRWANGAGKRPTLALDYCIGCRAFSRRAGDVLDGGGRVRVGHAAGGDQAPGGVLGAGRVELRAGASVGSWPGPVGLLKALRLWWPSEGPKLFPQGPAGVVGTVVAPIGHLTVPATRIRRGGHSYGPCSAETRLAPHRLPPANRAPPDSPRQSAWSSTSRTPSPARATPASMPPPPGRSGSSRRRPAAAPTGPRPAARRPGSSTRPAGSSAGST